MPPRIRAAFIVGPTAIGKTALAVALAEALARRGMPAEIVSCDSRQLFRGMDIGTAKPTPEERRRVPHHLIDVIEPTEAWSAGRFAREARACLGDLVRRGVSALIVGGSGLYVAALRDGLADIPSDPVVRRRLSAECEREGSPALHRRLAGVDPAAAAGIHPNNRERVVRALEVYEITGRPISAHWRAQRLGEGAARVPAPVLGLRAERRWLYERIDRRVASMFDAGLLDEVRVLLGRGFGRDWPAYRTVGYPEAVGCVEGRIERVEAVAAVAKATRHYARRQLTWFRADRSISWLDVPAADHPTAVSDLTERISRLPLTPILPGAPNLLDPERGPG